MYSNRNKNKFEELLIKISLIYLTVVVLVFAQFIFENTKVLDQLIRSIN